MCCFYDSESCQAGVWITPEQMRQLAAFQTPLIMDYFFAEKDEEE